MSEWMIRVLRAALQYGLLFFLVFFLWQVVRRIAPDVRTLTKTDTPQGGAVLIVTASASADEVGRRFAFRESITVGRAADNDIVLDESFISHHHLAILRRNNLYAAEDLGSANHTYVNGTLLSGSVYLKAGDEIRLGNAVLRFARC